MDPIILQNQDERDYLPATRCKLCFKSLYPRDNLTSETEAVDVLIRDKSLKHRRPRKTARQKVKEIVPVKERQIAQP